MNSYLAAKARSDTRGMHYAYQSLRRDLHIELARYEYGWWSRHYRALKKMMVGK